MVSDKTAPVAIVMGSDSDLKVMSACADQLKQFGVNSTMRIISAHRTPQIATEFAETAIARGIKVIVAGAGMAAHLAGAMAAHSTLPIIGVPLACEPGLSGMDALLSTVQMPPGVPVATMGIGKAGAKNAAILAVQIMALADEGLQKKLIEFKKKQAEAVCAKDAALAE